MKLNTLTRSMLTASALGLSLTSANVTAATDQNDAKIKQLEEQINLLADQIESSTSGSSSTTVGGYGELHYNNLDSKTEMDFHRFVIFIGHEFTNKIRFHSEFELEHAIAGEGKAGEVELEQAYIEFDISKNSQAKAGVFLIPVGIINETHEPDTFYGVERNPVEKNIIPATWWEAGAMYSAHSTGGISYDVAVHSGLKTSSADSYAPRKGRQKVAKAQADDLALTGRVKWTGINGLEIGAAAQHQSDITQGNDATAGAANLIEAHLRWANNGVTLTALTSQWSLDGTGPQSIGADKQTGTYFEASYKLSSKVGVFARYNQWDNKAGSATDTGKTQTDVGLNYWPHEKVVVKLDVMEQGDTASDKGFNIGLGYSF